MYICLCNSVTDRDIKHAVGNGADNLDALRDQLGVASRCGRCACMSQALIDETLDELGAEAMNLPYAAA